MTNVVQFHFLISNSDVQNIRAHQTLSKQDGKTVRKFELETLMLEENSHIRN